MEPLVLNVDHPNKNTGAFAKDDLVSYTTPCLKCEERFMVMQTSCDKLLKHLLEMHKLVIADVDSIADLTKYLEFWRPRILHVPLELVCIKITAECSTGDGASSLEDYYMLSTELPDDREIRNKLNQNRLQSLLNQQQIEREDNSSNWKCLFCGLTFQGNRSLVLNHMNSEHSFNIGHPDNLVNVTELLSILSSTLDRLVCLYCEKTFKDKPTLKEHMRKKFHKRLNPRNKDYDRFYVVNYLVNDEHQKPEQKFETRRGRGGVIAHIRSPEYPDSDVEEGWVDCDDSSSHILSAVCLFCTHADSHAYKVFLHMKDTHGFDMAALKLQHQLSFYQQVKVINYIRRQVHEKKCLNCTECFDSKVGLLEHLVKSEHITEFLDDQTTWNQPEYFFPTFENDNLLSGLDDDGKVEDEDWIIPEDMPSLEHKSQTEILEALRSVHLSSSAEDGTAEDNVLKDPGNQQPL